MVSKRHVEVWERPQHICSIDLRITFLQFYSIQAIAHIGMGTLISEGRRREETRDWLNEIIATDRI